MLKRAFAGVSLVILALTSCSGQADPCVGLNELDRTQCELERAEGGIAFSTELGTRVTLGAAIGAAIGAGVGFATGLDPLSMAMAGAAAGGVTAFAERYVNYLVALGDRNAALSRYMNDLKADNQLFRRALYALKNETSAYRQDVHQIRYLTQEITGRLDRVESAAEANKRSFAEQKRQRNQINETAAQQIEEVSNTIDTVEARFRRLFAETNDILRQVEITNRTYRKTAINLGYFGNEQIQSLNSRLASIEEEMHALARAQQLDQQTLEQTEGHAARAQKHIGIW